MNLIPSWPLLAAFLVASFILAITPGPGVIYIVTRSLAEGRLAGVISALGVAVGNLGNALAAALGLGAILAVSPTAFAVIRVLGGGYLLFIGIQTLRKTSGDGRTSKSENGDILCDVSAPASLLRLPCQRMCSLVL